MDSPPQIATRSFQNKPLPPQFATRSFENEPHPDTPPQVAAQRRGPKRGITALLDHFLVACRLQQKHAPTTSAVIQPPFFQVLLSHLSLVHSCYHVIFWDPMEQLPLLSPTVGVCPPEQCTGVLNWLKQRNTTKAHS